MLTVLPIPSRSEIRSFLSYSFLIKVASLGKGGHLFCESARNGGIAQLVEHLPCKQGVIGSNPITSTITGSQLSWLEHTPDKREVDGPSPFEPTIRKEVRLKEKAERTTLMSSREEDLQLHSKENKFFLLKDRKDEYERQKFFILRKSKANWLISKFTKGKTLVTV